MTLHCAFIGFGKSTTRYHLPYVLNRKDSWHVAHIFRRRAKPEEQSPQYSHIHFTSDLDEVLNDPQVKLVVVCTHADSHFEYAKRALEAGKNVLVEKPFTPTLEEANTLFALANSKGLTVTPYQNRRFDSCFLTPFNKLIQHCKLHVPFQDAAAHQPQAQAERLALGLPCHNGNNAVIRKFIHQLAVQGDPVRLFCHGTDVVVGKNTWRKSIRFIRFHGIVIV